MIKNETGGKDADFIKIKYIKFSHKKGGFDKRALDIRMNFNTPVTVPEYEAGANSKDMSKKDLKIQAKSTPNYPAAYSINSIGKNPITIRAFFKCDSKLKTAKIRATSTGILGEIKEQWHSLNKEVPIKLDSHKIASKGITKEFVTWNWEYSIDGTNWLKMGSTTHTIYVVLNDPKAPWDMKKETEKPWAEVLDIACTVANGKTSLGDAYAAIKNWITQILDGRGGIIPITFPFRIIDLVYTVGDTATYVKNNVFECSQFLKEIFKVPKKVNRFDCIAIVTTLTSILGYDIPHPENLVLWDYSDLGATYRTRIAWKADPVIVKYKPTPIGKKPKDYYDTIVVHSTDRPQYENIKELQKYHQEDRKWADLGYHFVINGHGTIYEGRDINIVGSHVTDEKNKDLNPNKIGITMMGNFQPKGWYDTRKDNWQGAELTYPTAAQISSLRALIRVLDSLYWIDISKRHVDFNKDKPCPGINAYRMLDEEGFLKKIKSTSVDLIYRGYTIK